MAALFILLICTYVLATISITKIYDPTLTVPLLVCLIPATIIGIICGYIAYILGIPPLALALILCILILLLRKILILTPNQIYDYPSGEIKNIYKVKLDYIEDATIFFFGFIIIISASVFRFDFI